jgi:3-hydroxybutyryl-CoA dehydratase
MSVATALDLSVGDVLPERRHLVDQPLIARYARASGDMNPLHLDPEFAKATKFGRTIAHGMMTLAFVSQLMSETLGSAWAERGRLAMTFVAPVFADDEVIVRAVVLEVSSVLITFEVQCWVADRLTLTGEAGLLEDASCG